MKKHLLNIVGILVAFGMIIGGLLFAIWQLDIIVSGPVWWQSIDGVGWSHPNGAYQYDYFQCFLWKTTVGMAYDTLFTMICVIPVLGAIILFLSLWYWND